MNERNGIDVLAAQIDRLVSGDLAGAERRSLLAWLDEEPERWRACSLAFLEAQTWQQAAGTSGFSDSREEEGARGRAGSRSLNARDQSSPPPLAHSCVASRRLRWLAVAALVLVAFALGLASGHAWPTAALTDGQFAGPTAPSEPSSGGPLLASVSLPTNLDPRLKAELTLPLAADGQAPRFESSIPAYVRQQWERRGFELTEEVRYLPAKLPDGRQVMVPITKVHVKYKGLPVS